MMSHPGAGSRGKDDEGREQWQQLCVETTTFFKINSSHWPTLSKLDKFYCSFFLSHSCRYYKINFTSDIPHFTVEPQSVLVYYLSLSSITNHFIYLPSFSFHERKSSPLSSIHIYISLQLLNLLEPQPPILVSTLNCNY